MDSPMSDTNNRSRHNLSTILQTINKRKYQNQKPVFSYQFSYRLPTQNNDRSIPSSGSKQLLNSLKKYKNNFQSSNRSLLLNGRYRTLENRDSNYYLRKIKEVEKNNKINCQLQQLCQTGKNDFMPLEKLEDKRKADSPTTDLKKASNHMIMQRLKKYIEQRQKLMQVKKLDTIESFENKEELSKQKKERKKSQRIQIFQINNVLKCRRSETQEKSVSENQNLINEPIVEKQKCNFPPIQTNIKKIFLLPKDQKNSRPFINSVGKSQAEAKFKGSNFYKNSVNPIKNQNVPFRESINMWSYESTVIDHENPNNFDFLHDYI